MATFYFGGNPPGLEEAHPFGTEPPPDGGGGGGASAADVWLYVMTNGKTAEQNVLEIHAMLAALSLDAIATSVWSKELPL